MRKLWAISACVGVIVFALPVDAASGLSLDKAITLALQHSPVMTGAEADYAAAKGERRQASAFPNPTIGLDAENITGSGIYNGTDSAELTAGVSQMVEIGGKRSARIQAADQGRIFARYGQSTARLNLIRDVSIAFANAVTAQEEATLASEQAKLAKDVYNVVNKRVNAAAEPIVQRNKAKISLANAELIAERAKGQRTAALKMLTSIWGNSGNASILSSDDFYKITEPQTNLDIQKLLQNTIDYKQQSINVDQAKSLLDLEKANAIPNPSFTFGIRDFRATDDQALVVGVSLPIPVFNINGGNIEKARQQSAKAESLRQKLLLDGQSSLIEHSQQLQNAYLTATKIKNDILPEAREAFAQAKRGYNAGKFAYLEVLDAQRTLTDTRLAYIQSLRDYHIQKAEVDRLIAQDIPSGENQ